MNLSEITKTGIEPALALLPEKMATPAARVLLLAIGLQDSRFLYHRQLGDGPAGGGCGNSNAVEAWRQQGSALNSVTMHSRSISTRRNR